MKYLKITLIAVVILAFSPLSSLAGPPSSASEKGVPPESISFAEPTAKVPLWIPASSAVDSTGGLDPTRLPRLERMIRRVQPDPEKGCYFFGPSEASTIVGSGGFTPQERLDDLQTHSQAIVLGRVVEVREGFFSQRPASLLVVEIGEILRQSGRFDLEETLLVHYPYARFRVGDLEFCKEDPRYSYRPEVGDDVLVFAIKSPLDAGRRLVDVTSNGLFAEKAGGSLVLPEGLRDRESLTEYPSLTELTQGVKRRLEKTAGAEGS